MYGGSALELSGGISVAEPFTISGDGNGVQSGALVNVGGNNTLTGAITLLGTTIRSDSGNLIVNAPDQRRRDQPRARRSPATAQLNGVVDHRSRAFR